MDFSPPGSSVHGILQARIWSGLPIPSPGDLPHPEIKPVSFKSPALTAGSLPLVPPGKPSHHGDGLVTKLCPTLASPWTVACQAPLCVGFSRQEYWSGLPFPSPFYSTPKLNQEDIEN